MITFPIWFFMVIKEIYWCFFPFILKSQTMPISFFFFLFLAWSGGAKFVEWAVPLEIVMNHTTSSLANGKHHYQTCRKYYW